MRRGLTLIELLVVLAIAAVLAAVLFPALPRPRHLVRREYCGTNLKQIGTGLTMYAQDYDDRLPPHGYIVGTRSYALPHLLNPYLKNALLWECTRALQAGDHQGRFDGSPADTTVHYGYNWTVLEKNGTGIRLDRVHDLGATLSFAESTSYLTAPRSLVPVLGGTPPAYRHGKIANTGWLDGHVKMMTAEKLESSSAGDDAGAGSGIDAYPYWKLN